MRIILNFILILFISMTLSGCISSLLKEPAPTFSYEIELPKSINDFTEQNTSNFPSWKNKKTLNVISIISECSDQNLNLKSAHSLITNAIDNETLIEEKKTNLQNHKAFFRKVSGHIEEHKLVIQSLSFKYKNCFYISSLSGNENSYQHDLKNWTQFNQNIQFKK